jgi:hypothetical protein
MIMSATVLHAGLGRAAGRNLTNTAWSIVEGEMRNKPLAFPCMDAAITLVSWSAWARSTIGTRTASYVMSSSTL